ncbi:MAG: hypothetical protein LBG94_09275 [Treponema sp.]|jgi:hypothetical protein|nr:hypothetical protein [Treponema sp.]
MNKLFLKLTVLLLVFGLVFMSCDEPGGSGGRNLLNGLEGESIVSNLENSGPTSVNNNEGTEGNSNGGGNEGSGNGNEGSIGGEQPDPSICTGCGKKKDKCICGPHDLKDHDPEDTGCPDSNCEWNNDVIDVDIKDTTSNNGNNGTTLEDVENALIGGKVVILNATKSWNSGNWGGMKFYLGNQEVISVVTSNSTIGFKFKVNTELNVTVSVLEAGERVKTTSSPDDNGNFTYKPNSNSAKISFEIKLND